MNHTLFPLTSGLAAVLQSIAGGVAVAENGSIAALPLAKIGLAQAVAKAETVAGGKATRAVLEDSRDGPRYSVEVVSDERIVDLWVSAMDGRILAARADL